ncbi:MAG: hypothetical protein INF71_18285 [Roseomonas sp.]|nr:hypothetical protein [Roseomonas sp.]
MKLLIKYCGNLSREARTLHQQPFVKGFRDAVQILQQFAFTKRREVGPEQIGGVGAGQDGSAIHPACPLVQADHFGIGFQDLIRQGTEGKQQLPQGLPQAGAGLLVRHPIPEQGRQFRPWHPLPGMKAKITQDGSGLAAAGHQILTQIADGP